MNDLIIGQRVHKRNRSLRIPPNHASATFARRPALAPFKKPAGKSLRLPRLPDFPRLPQLRRLPAAAAAAVVVSVPLLLAAVAFAYDAAYLLYAESKLAAPGSALLEGGMKRFAETGAVYEEADASGDLPPLDLAETFKFESYVVRAGDTISSIAAKRSLSLGSIISANRIANVKSVRVGAELRIPNMDGVPYEVRKGDSLLRIASSWGIPVEAILDANDLNSETIHAGTTLFLPGARMKNEDLRMALGDLFAYPVSGRLTSPFGWRDDPFTGARRFHAGIDLAAPVGTPIRAAMAGKVSSVGVNAIYGKYVIVTHSGGYQTWYAHLNDYATVKGKQVAQGERIGFLGNTGYSTGPHLHFSIFKNGRAVDPLRFLGGR